MIDAVLLTIWTIGWTVFGGLIGYVFGRVATDVHRIANSQEGATTMDRVGRPGRARWWHRFSGQFVLGLVVVLLGVLTVLQGLAQNQQTTRLQQCQAHYANAFADALDARTAASNASQRAMDGLVSAIGSHVSGKPGDQAAIRAAVQHYSAERHKAAQERARHPLPPPPRETCQEGR